MVSPASPLHELRPSPRSEAAARVAELGTILGVWAHPDDEVYLSAGIMRLALENGQRVACITATLGERGTDDPVTWPPEVLGPKRRVELHSSLDVLATGRNTIDHRWLDHRDGHCADIRPAVVATQIGAAIDRVRPDTILTFDPGGITGHPDHQAVSQWVSVALESRPTVGLLQAVVARSWADHFGGAIDLGSYFDEGYPQIVDDADTDLNLVLDDGLWAVKDEALRAHATQVDPVIDHLGPELWRAFSINESFVSSETSTSHQHRNEGART